jgi:DNA polymerase elongation subunit (family B)
LWESGSGTSIKVRHLYTESRKKTNKLSLARKGVAKMSIYLQPCDWIEHDVNYKYVVDAFGRTQNGDVARVRIIGFKPYVYLRAEKDETSSVIQNFLKGLEKPIRSATVSIETKQDAMRGFSNLQTTRVWKIECKSLWEFKSVVKGLRNGKIGTRKIQTEDIYEADLPPLLRLFHERDISPASPIEFEDNAVEPEEGFRADISYEVEYDSVSPYDKISIPLLVGSYDIEVYSSTGQFPVSSNPGDEITQIGLSLRWNDTLLQSEARYVFVNGSCEPSKDPSVTFIPCRNEKDLLHKFEKCIHDENPDVLIGYNTFGFDDAYIADRAARCGISLEFGRVDVKQWGDRRENVKTDKKTFELAAGKFAVRYIAMPGRQNLDLYLSMRREQNLDSYKLDNVANKFLRDKVASVVEITGERTQMYEVHTKSTRGLFPGNLVRFDIVTNTVNPYKNGKKVFVKEVHPKKFIVELPHADYLFDDVDESQLKKLEWSFAKDDVDHHEIFKAHVGSDADRSYIAKYCIQDCDLVLTLIAKLDTLVNARGMADVCRVPVDYTFIRGQGIKIYSAVVYNASKRNQIIMTQDSVDGDTSYEGAIVLPPKIGMYLDQPIPVLDFNSLYPSNMIAYNLSPDTLVYVKKYNSDGKRTYQWPNEIPVTEFKVDEISYDERDGDGKPIGRVICGFAQPREDGTNTGLLPLTLDILLKKRKETRKKMEQTDDDAQKSVLNGLQLAYKVVANSVYGQCGSKTSAIRNLYVAACTTAAGRQRIYDAKRIVETEFGGEVIYGDTDSIFIKFPTKDLAESIKFGQMAADKITQTINRRPYRIEYEKTLFPFILFCRKRYVGMLYEDDPSKKPKRKEMGIALKRRDSAPIVKDVFGGALDILMEERDIRKAQRFVNEKLADVLQNKVPLDKFIITKQLGDNYAAMKEDYKGPATLPAHVVLANRMKERDPGSAPQVGDRIPFLYVLERTQQKKQGDRIEHLDYVREHKLTPDAAFYVTNQIQNPVAQMFALALEKLEGYKQRINYAAMLNTFMEDEMDEEEATLKVLDRKEKELDELMFQSVIKKYRKGPMDAFLKR